MNKIKSVISIQMSSKPATATIELGRPVEIEFVQYNWKPVIFQLNQSVNLRALADLLLASADEQEAINGK